jgi:hypothetical protein
VLGDEDLDEAIEDAIAMAAIGDLDLDFDLFDDDED